MSVRQTEEFAQEASRFSLRSIFPMALTMRTQASDYVPQAQAPPVPHPLSQPLPQMQPHAVTHMAAAKPQLRFNLPIHTPATAQSAVAHEQPFKFSMQAKQASKVEPLARAAAPTESASHHEFAPTALTGVSPPTSSNPPPMSEIHAIPVDVHDAEIARMVQIQVELGEKLKLCEAKLATTSNSVTKGNQALATERMQFKQKILAMNEQLNAITEREKRATDALALRADQSAELDSLKLLVDRHKTQSASVSQDYRDLSQMFEEFKTMAETDTVALSAKSEQVASLTTEIATLKAEATASGEVIESLKVQAATAENQIDELDGVIAGLRAAPEPEPVSGHCGGGSAHAAPAPADPEEQGEEEEGEGEGEEVVETGASVAVPPMVVCISTCCEESHEHAGAQVDAHKARAHLAKRMHDNACCMGVSSVGDDVPLNLHHYTETGEPSEGLKPAQVASSEATDAVIRTNTYVKQVSEDIKKHMTGQRNLWLQTATVGAHAC